jgi:hypothetical protein
MGGVAILNGVHRQVGLEAIFRHLPTIGQRTFVTIPARLVGVFRKREDRYLFRDSASSKVMAHALL